MPLIFPQAKFWVTLSKKEVEKAIKEYVLSLMRAPGEIEIVRVEFLDGYNVEVGVR